MKKNLVAFLLLVSSVESFTAVTQKATFAVSSSAATTALFSTREPKGSSRRNFLFTTATATATTVVGVGVVRSGGDKDAAFARGRATLEQAYDRYTPRIVAGGKFYASDMKKLIGNNDFAGLVAATADPPKKKSKQDLSKSDGGAADRAALAGGFSDARVLVACDLYAATFSDNSISQKTKRMKEQVEIMRNVTSSIRALALAQSSSSSDGGGLFGGGSKKIPKAEAAQKIRALYVQGGNAWNQYVFVANDDLPIFLNRLPYL